MTYNITITGIPAIEHDLQQIRVDVLQQDIADLLDEIAADAANYPPERPGQRYIRTNALRDGWLDATPVFQTSATSLLAVLTNPVPYGPEVMGASDQAKVHQGRWRTTDQIMDAWEDRAAAAVETALMRKVGT